MKKNIILFVSGLCVALMLSEGILRVAGYKESYFLEKKNSPVIRPDSFFVKDDVLGFRLGIGEFNFYHHDSLYARCKINGNGCREIDHQKYVSHKISNHPLINIYGDSFTFGQSVSDTSNYPYYLQTMLADVWVNNKGVPGYSLLQMYLSMQEDIDHGRQPDIAVIGYDRFQDERTVLSREWLDKCRDAFLAGKKLRLADIHYPYAKIEGESLSIDYLNPDLGSSYFTLGDKSALIALINRLYNRVDYKRHAGEYEKITLLLFDKIKKSCDENGIRLVCFGLSPDAKPVTDVLWSKGMITTCSRVNIDEQGFNCAPFDAVHPSAKAHQIFAREVMDCLVHNKLIE